MAQRSDLERNLSLHNDVLFSLLMVAQLVINIAGELAARRGGRFDDYTEALRRLDPIRCFVAVVAAVKAARVGGTKGSTGSLDRQGLAACTQPCDTAHR